MQITPNLIIRILVCWTMFLCCVSSFYIDSKKNCTNTGAGRPLLEGEIDERVLTASNRDYIRTGCIRFVNGQNIQGFASDSWVSGCFPEVPNWNEKSVLFPTNGDPTSVSPILFACRGHFKLKDNSSITIPGKAEYVRASRFFTCYVTHDRKAYKYSYSNKYRFDLLYKASRNPTGWDYAFKDRIDNDPLAEAWDVGVYLPTRKPISYLGVANFKYGSLTRNIFGRVNVNENILRFEYDGKELTANNPLILICQWLQ